MNRKQPVHAYGDNPVYTQAILVGGGDAANLTLPTDIPTKRVNAAASGTRTGEGVYSVVLALDSAPPQVNQTIPHCEGGDHRAEVTTAYVASTRTVVITVRNSGGTADDLPTTEKLMLLLVGRDSTS